MKTEVENAEFWSFFLCSVAKVDLVYGKLSHVIQTASAW